ncbi:cytosine permease, partial [Streptomyces sp. MCAF7]
FTIVLWFVLVLAVTMTISVLGHEFIMKVEVWISWVTGIMTVAFLGFMVPEIEWSHLGDTPAGGPLVFIGGIIMAMTLVGLGFLNYGGDFARYLPRATPARGVIGWTVAGLSLPVVILLAVGALLVGGDSKLGAATASDPIGALTELLPMWFFVPFSIIIVISLVSAAITGMY